MDIGRNKGHFDIVAKTHYGLESVLAQEVAELGADNIRILNRAVSYTGDTAFLYRSSYCLRTALRILKPVLSVKISDENGLYKAIRSILWYEWLDKKGTLAVDAVVKSRFFTHSHYVAQKVKDAIVDQFRDRYGIRPSVNLEDPDLRINVHISEKTLTVSLDSSGESLHKRGYRVSAWKANLNEVLAAGMILLTGWKGDTSFIDLMCGSGTLPVEAAMIAHKIPAGYYRHNFGFQHWPDYRPELFEKIKKENLPVYNHAFLSYGSDNAAEAIRAARRNAAGAGLTDYMQFALCDIGKAKKSFDKGLIVINPPYGERLQQDDLNILYKRIGDTLKNSFSGFDAWILSSNQTALKHIGLHPDKRLTLYNGQLECKYNHYSLYPGSRKTRNPEPGTRNQEPGTRNQEPGTKTKVNRLKIID